MRTDAQANPAFRLFSWRGVLALLLAAPMLNGCGGFVVRQPQADPYEILTLRNDRASSVSTFSKYLVEPQALPIPVASQAELQRLSQSGPPPASLAAADIGPIGVGPNAVRATPAGQAITQQSNYALDPITTLGRLNFTRANGQTRYCSAQLVGDTGVVLTAGHCVFDGRFGGGAGTGWAIDIEYAFAYGSVSPGTQYFDWECAAVFKGWALDSPTYDYAFVKLRGNALRALGLKQSAFQSGSATSMGYPGNISSSIASYVNATPALAQATIVRHSPNPFGGGSSGGAWVDIDRAESLNSFTSNQPNVMFGPLFTNKTLELYEYVKAGCPVASSSKTAHVSSPSVLARAGEATAPKQGELAPTRQQFAAIEDGTAQAQAYATGDKAVCACASASPKFVSNLTDSSRRVVVSARRARIDGTDARPARAELDLAPRERRFLGCSKLEGTCAVAQDFWIESSTRLRTSAGSASSATPVSLPVSIEACVDRCEAGDSAWCQRLGARPSAALLPLGSLLKASERSPDPNSVVLKRHEVISTLGGDPSKDEDPCARSDIVLNGGRLGNSGAQCRLRSRNILEDQAKELFLILDINPLLSWRKGAPSEAAFDRANEEPYVEFGGEDSRALTDAYAGRVQATRAVKNGLVVATENGCLMAVDPSGKP